MSAPIDTVGDKSSSRKAKRSDDAVQLNETVAETVALDHKEFTHWFTVRWFDDTATLKREARKSLGNNVKLDTVAFTCTWSNKDSIEQGKVDCSGEIFLLKDASAGVIAHEATHMALGILNREGYENLPITTDNAPEVEEELGALVAFITDEINAQLLETGRQKTLDLVESSLPEKIKEYPIKIVSRDDPKQVWDSNMTHGLNEKDSAFNQAIDQTLAVLKELRRRKTR